VRVVLGDKGTWTSTYQKFKKLAMSSSSVGLLVPLPEPSLAMETLAPDVPRRCKTGRDLGFEA
jgi:hypothetical protein